jgi:hypothetical protein
LALPRGGQHGIFHQIGIKQKFKSVNELMLSAACQLDNFEEEVALAEKYTQMRILHVGRGESETVQLEIGTNIERLWTLPDNGIRKFTKRNKTHEEIFRKNIVHLYTFLKSTYLTECYKKFLL